VVVDYHVPYPIGTNMTVITKFKPITLTRSAHLQTLLQRQRRPAPSPASWATARHYALAATALDAEWLFTRLAINALVIRCRAYPEQA
jgi:hypothetical protein